MISEAEIKSRSVALYDAAVKELAKLALSLETYTWPSANQIDRMQRAAIGTLIIHTLELSKAIAALLQAGLGSQILPMVRAQFEMAVKLAYIEKYPKKGGDFLLSEPFERYWLAKDYEISSARLATIVADCKAVVANNPALINYQTSKNSRPKRADFLAIRTGLSFPLVRDMVLDLQWHLDLYVMIFLFGSIDIHGSIIQLRNYIEDIHTTSPRLIIKDDAAWPPDYVLQSLAYVLGMIGGLDKWFFVNPNETETIKALWEEHTLLTTSLLSLESSHVPHERVRRRGNK